MANDDKDHQNMTPEQIRAEMSEADRTGTELDHERMNGDEQRYMTDEQRAAHADDLRRADERHRSGEAIFKDHRAADDRADQRREDAEKKVDQERSDQRRDDAEKSRDLRKELTPEEAKKAISHLENAGKDRGPDHERTQAQRDLSAARQITKDLLPQMKDLPKNPALAASKALGMQSAIFERMQEARKADRKAGKNTPDKELHNRIAMQAQRDVSQGKTPQLKSEKVAKTIDRVALGVADLVCGLLGLDTGREQAKQREQHEQSRSQSR